MTISLENCGKRYERDWIFRNLTYRFSSGNKYAILGPNGSGKSTLIQMLCGFLSPTEGEMKMEKDNSTISGDDAFRYVSLCAPYIQLIEEFTLREQVEFHLNFKPAMGAMKSKQLIELMVFETSAEKQIRYFSSGMKQRVKLCLTILSDVPIILLDEPATNLDGEGIKWYKNILDKFLNDRLLIISSNREEEYSMCDERIEVSRFKVDKPVY